MRLNLEEIMIPGHMLPPKDYRLRAAISHVNNGSLYPIKVERSSDGYWILTDGYARYLALQECGQDFAEVVE